MRKVKEVLRLNASGMSNRKIARSLNQSRPSVANYLRRAADAGLEWPHDRHSPKATPGKRLPLCKLNQLIAILGCQSEKVGTQLQN